MKTSKEILDELLKECKTAPELFGKEGYSTNHHLFLSKAGTRSRIINPPSSCERDRVKTDLPI